MGFLAGIAQAVEHLAHPAFRIGDAKRLLDPMAGLLGCLEAIVIELRRQFLDLLCGKVGGRTANFPGTESIQTACVVAVEPIMDAVFAGKENGGNIAIGPAIGFEKDALDAVTQPNILFSFIATDEFGALIVRQRE